MSKQKSNLVQIGSRIPEQLKEIFNAILGMEEYAIVAKKTGYSLSGVCNIINLRYNVTKNNIVVVEELINIANIRLREERCRMGDLLFELSSYEE